MAIKEKKIVAIKADNRIKSHRTEMWLKEIRLKKQMQFI